MSSPRAMASLRASSAGNSSAWKASHAMRYQSVTGSNWMSRPGSKPSLAQARRLPRGPGPGPFPGARGCGWPVLGSTSLVSTGHCSEMTQSVGPKVLM